MGGSCRAAEGGARGGAGAAPASGCVQAAPLPSELLPLLIQGVSNRLGSPLPSVRAQGMRVGRVFAGLLDPGKPLFGEQGALELQAEEAWPGCGWRPAAAAGGGGGQGGSASSQQQQQQHAGHGVGGSTRPHERQQQEVLTGGGGASAEGGRPSGVGGSRASQAPAAQQRRSALDQMTEAAGQPDSDDDDDAISLAAYDLEEDIDAEDWEAEGKVAALRPLAAALRKHDNVTAVLDALSRAEILIRASPDELPTFAPELSRSLLHCRVPEWAQPDPGGQAPEAARMGALSALLSMAPLEAGDSLLAEVWSPHLDQYQRLLILDALVDAARELADPRAAPRLEAGAVGGGGGRGAPRVLPPAASAAARPAVAALTGADGGGIPGGGGGLRAASTRVWGTKRLQQLREQGGSGGGGGRRTWRNRFSPVAARWASGLLSDCDRRRQGVDLFGRDALVLSRLVATLGAFVDSVAQTPVAFSLSAGLLELLRSPQVSGHAEAAVRRAALLAAAHVLGALPPARLAGAMVGRDADALDHSLVERLQWLAGWLRGVAAADGDERCRMLAAGCGAMHADLAAQAMAALEALPAPEMRVPLPGAGGPRAAALNIHVPTLHQLSLG